MVKSEQKSTNSKENKKRDTLVKNTKDKNQEKDKETEIDAVSQYYKIGDAVDCTDNAHGAWYEAIILRIFFNAGKLFYKIRWDLTDSNDEPFNVEEKFLRPRAWKVLNFDELEIGQRVMLNYNLENAKEIGYWYDFTIKKIECTQSINKLTGTIHVGNQSNIYNNIDNCTTNTSLGVYRIEKPVLLTERDDTLTTLRIPKSRREIPVKCKSCQDNPRKKCRECSCRVCAEKKDPHLTLLCDECDDAYHLSCLKPPLTEIPKDDDWYCPNCKVNANEIVRIGQKVMAKKVSGIAVVKKRDWGKGMACVGRTKVCTIVPLNHKGPIPGIEVGTTWKYRFQVSEAGVHRPHVAGIHGRSDMCAFSIVLSGGYEDDVDNGEEFFYTGSGGRDLSGNKRTAKQSSDQQLTLMNKALALNCKATLNPNGAEATDWKQGIPIRVVRNFKLAKHSHYAPNDGNRYDGIYKVVKYWQGKGQSGFKVWRYLLRRDDPVPAPWTKEGIARIKELNLKIIYPEGYQEALKKKNKENGAKNNQKNETKKRKLDLITDTIDSPAKKQKNGYKLNNKLLELIETDSANAKLWSQCREYVADGKQAFYEKVAAEFICIICQDLVHKPITTPCAHNICSACLKRSFEVNSYTCPMCRSALEKNYKIEINETLQSILLFMFTECEPR
ncbi:E3 ubiquitin-protein ligase UHRF1-like [Copidosoma floridanum]|nr:E3 ubiquitin-protein ligase UHRF1 isoform X2 [Copidosoma floridanum]XP_023248650.1 E3 ubiquitin-protein ligase UHRF1-like [Copidosoma floridanum]